MLQITDMKYLIEIPTENAFAKMVIMIMAKIIYASHAIIVGQKNKFIINLK